ncbi:hypothetical protein [Streptomyces celluloflavus]|uniref:hypothetical protein n=1 Tax=Streptomyces celluloflavus TaxID=58344 RepID=UPI00367DC585
MDEIVAPLIAQITRILTDPATTATDVMYDIREAYDHEDWEPAMDTLWRTETPTTLGGVRYETSDAAAHAIDAAAAAAWDAVRELFEPDIDAISEARGDEAMEDPEGTSSTEYLDTLYYWKAACRPRDIYPRDLKSLSTWHEIRDANKFLMTGAVRDYIAHAVHAVIVKDHLNDAHYRALTSPFDDTQRHTTDAEDEAAPDHWAEPDEQGPAVMWADGSAHATPHRPADHTDTPEAPADGHTR